jgi:hypothetical protein
MKQILYSEFTVVKSCISKVFRYSRLNRVQPPKLLMILILNGFMKPMPRTTPEKVPGLSRFTLANDFLR